MTEVVEALDISSQIGRVHLTLPKRYTIEQWVATGQELLAVRDRAQFLLGDLLIEGARRFGDRHAQLYDHRNNHTLRKWKYVCERIPPKRRVESLSFRHHDGVSSLDAEDQDELLDLAVRKGWNSDEIRAAAEERRALREREQQGEEETDETAAIKQADGSEVLPPSKFGAPQLRKAEEVDRRPGDGSDEPGELVEPEPVGALLSEPVGPVLRIDDVGVKSDESATYLRSVARTTSSQIFRNSLTDILDERVVLIDLVKLVKRAVEVDQITPELRAAVG